MRRFPMCSVLIHSSAILLFGCDGSQTVEPSMPEERLAAARGVPASQLAAPSNFAAVATSETRIDLSWKDNSSSESKFEIYRSIQGLGDYTLLTSPSSDAVAHSDTGLVPMVPYCYWVRAVRVTGNKSVTSAPSNVSCASTVLATPANLSARAGSAGELEISWSDNSSHEVSYWLYRSSAGQPGTMTLLTTTAANVATYTDRGLHGLTEYCYRVSTVGPFPLRSEYSNTACATTVGPPSPIPAAATGTTAVPSENRILVTWIDNATNELGYRIYSSTNGGAWILRGSTQWPAFVDEPVQPEQIICYRIVAFNPGGEAAPDMDCTALPAAPSNLIITQAGENLVIAWADNSGVEDGYQVFQYMSHCYQDNAGAAEGPELVGTLPPNSTSHTFPVPFTNDCHYFMGVIVVATKDGGVSAFVGMQ